MTDFEADRGTPPFRYDARLAGQIELRWQERWAEAGTFDAPNPAGPLAAGFDQAAGRPKFYVLDMFPAPSGTGIHVGHLIGYVGTDVYARYLRMTGWNVLHTMGYDAFGLPAEQFAVETGQHPGITSRQNIATMRHQLRRLGMGYDLRRSVSTTDPGFYRWTQWIFLRLFHSWVDDSTGLARPIEELTRQFASGERAVPGGRRWAQLTEAQRRAVIDGFRLAYISEEPVNWCPALGTVLANEEVTADGRSDIGNHPVQRRPLRQWMLRITAMAKRLIDDLDLVDWPEPIKLLQRNWIGASHGAMIRMPVAGQPDLLVEMFSTRPDTLPGATFVVLAPEHPLAARLAAASWPDGTPERWRGPRPGEPAGTPAAAVAACRQLACQLPDRQRIAGGARTGAFTGAHVRNPMTGEPIPVFVADYVLLDYGTGAVLGVPAHDRRDAEFAAEFGLPVRQVPGADEADRAGAVQAAIDWLVRHDAGRPADHYRLRDWLFSRQRYWGEPFPIVYDEAGTAIALPESALPLLLPAVMQFKPDPDQDGTGPPVPPLARAAGWGTVELDLGDGPKTYRRELNTMPQWAGSCWYYLRYLDPDNDTAFVDPQVERYWMAPQPGGPGSGGVDLYVGGVEHAVLHLLYARFWHKVLFDLGLVSTPEPFGRLVNQGYILADAFTDSRGIYVPAAEVTQAADGTASYRGEPVTRRAGKMGKSKKNGVSPDDIYQAYGADTLRVYELAMGPLEAEKPWRTGDIAGAHRFLQRLWRCVISEQTGELAVTDAALDAETRRALHATIAVVRRDFGRLRFNTAIARLMELTSRAAQVLADGGQLPRALAEPLVLMAAPLAPHIAEELWHRLGHQESLASEPFPEADPALAGPAEVTIPVQVNGKTRFTVSVRPDATAAEIRQLVTGDPGYAAHTDGQVIERFVVVPGRIVNIVLR